MIDTFDMVVAGLCILVASIAAFSAQARYAYQRRIESKIDRLIEMLGSSGENSN